MLYVTKRMEFEMAHRLWDHPKQCKNIHGHTYKVEITISGMVIGGNMVMDFGEVKAIMQDVIGCFDHKILLHCEDPLVVKGLADPLPGLMVSAYMPTAENMVKAIAANMDNHLPNGVNCYEVKLWETSNSFATWRK